VELGMAEAENNELNRSDCHVSPFNRLCRHKSAAGVLARDSLPPDPCTPPWLIHTSAASSSLDETGERVVRPHRMM
jgi:hypothetical protein